MGTFDEFVQALAEGARGLAKDIFDGFEDQALADAKAFLDKSQNDLQRWTRLLAQEDIVEQDFSDLVHAKKALAEIHSLRQEGIALIRLERFRTGFINLVVETAFVVFL